MSVLISGARVIDPCQRLDRPTDLLISNGIIKKLGGPIRPDDQTKTIDATGLVLCPGFIDLHCHLREPGFEYKETIATGTKAAAKGGFTTVCAMPNTDPVVDNRAMVDFVIRKATEEGSVRVLPIASITKGSSGFELSDMGELFKAGVVGFSDDGLPVSDANIMRQALIYSSSFGLPIINHCEVTELSQGGLANEGWVSNLLGIQGIPNSSEEIMVARDIALAESTGGRIHIAHVSTAGSVELVRQSKKRGSLNVTCEVTPHHLTLGDRTLLGTTSQINLDQLTPSSYDTSAKVSPPLRSKNDIQALRLGLLDGTIDFIATDHAPHSDADKLCTLEDAEKGISNLETAFGSLMSLVHSGHIQLTGLVEKLTCAPAKFLGVDFGSLIEGSAADLAIIDPELEWTVDRADFLSKGRNTPLHGQTFKGQVVSTIVAGEVKFDDVGIFSD